jgi:PAS domain S-box-containing protein
MYLTPDGDIIALNESYAAMHGYTVEEMLAMNLHDIDTPETACLIPDRMRRILEGESLIFEVAHKRKDGSVISLEATANLVTDNDKKYILSVHRDITDRKRMEEKIKLVAREWTECFDTISDMITIHDADFNIIRANKAAESGLGLSMREILSNKCFKSYHGTICPPEKCPSCQTAKTGSPSTTELFEPHLNKYIEIKALPRFGADHTIAGLVHVVRDITEHKKAEIALKEKAEELASIYENSPIIMMLVDNERKVRKVNSAGLTFLNRQSEEVVGRRAGNVFNCIHSLDDPQGCGFGKHCQHCIVRKTIHDTFETGIGIRNIETILTFMHLGAEIDTPLLLSTAKLLIDDKPMVLICLLDITERKQAEMAARQANDRVMQILNSVAEGIYGLDLAANCVFINPAAVRLLGYQTEQELIGKNILHLVHHTRSSGELNPTEECVVDKAMRSGEYCHSAQELLWRKDGSSFPAEYWAYPNVKDSTIQGVVVSFVDRTEHVSMENQLRHAQKMEAIGVLAGGIAHDFNNILSAIIGYGEVSLLRMEQDDHNRLNIEHIMGAADRAAVLTQSLLAFSRKQILDQKPVDLNKIIARVERFIVRIIGEDINVRKNLTKKLLTVNADAGQLEQVFMNLATNSRDAMPKGGLFTIETTTICIDSSFIAANGYGKPGNYALVSITDTGSGMNEETRKKIFEPFFTTKDVGKGTGLGLAMVYGIIKQHDGFLNVYSEPGKGTTFKLYIPLTTAEAPKEHHPAVAEYPRGGAETILLAEDDENLIQLTAGVLEQMGYTVIQAHDGAEAVQKFQENRDKIDLLLFDVVMPKKSGKDAYEEIRKLHSGVPVLFASGYSSEALKQKKSLAENEEIIYKPISPTNLLKRVREMLDRKR